LGIVASLLVATKRQSPLPLPYPTPTSTPTATSIDQGPVYLQVIEAILNGDPGTVLRLLFIHYKWIGLLILLVLMIGLFYFWLVAPERSDVRGWLQRRAPWIPGLGKLRSTPAGIEPTLTTEGILEPLHPSEKERFVELSLFIPLEGEQKTQAPSERLRFKDLAEAMSATDDSTQQNFPAFALLGEPGAGKTTLLRQYAWLALSRYEQNPDGLIPLLIKLNSQTNELPIDFLRRRWQPLNYGLSFDAALNAGKVLLLADGLNEIERGQYPQLLGLWKAFLAQYCRANGNRAIVSCRLADYGEGLNIPQLVVRPMDDVRIQEFLAKYAPGLAAVIWKDIDTDRRDNRGDLYRLAKTPFWLEIMTQVATRDGLPRKRAGLVEALVDRRLNHELSQNPGLQVPSGWGIYFEGLTNLGWMGLLRSQNYAFPYQQAMDTLEDAGVCEQPTPGELLDLARSCGLLEFSGRNGKVSFHHQLFQEYFAARRLAEYFSLEKSPKKKFTRTIRKKLWRIPWRNWKFSYSSWGRLPRPPRTDWEEATVIAAGMPTSDSVSLIEAILRENPLLAGECVHHAGVALPADFRAQVLTRLQKQSQRPLPRVTPSAWGLNSLPGWLEKRFSLKRRDWLQARRLLLVSVRLEAEKQIGWFEDQPAVVSRRREALLSDEKKCVFIEPDWVTIPTGTFRMGSSDEETERLRRYRLAPYPDEKPGHAVELTRSFSIGRFPVTVAEYRCFMDAGGYFQDNYWQGEAALRWLHGKLNFQESYQYWVYVEQRKQAEAILPKLPRLVAEGAWTPAQARNLQATLAMSLEDLEKQWRSFENEKRDENGQATRPWLWDERDYRNPSQPVVGVSWYEAQAYAAWLTECLRQADRLPAGLAVKLPSEAQWEKAARGRAGFLWPWGDRWDSTRCNTLESRIQLPSPVGMYPHGASPYGAFDMAGNVWEWCQDWYDEKEYERRQGSPVLDPSGPETGQARVIRGGSWNFNRSLARCAYRNWSEPGDFNRDLGFRVALSPS
jgi:formylglycine-generating enzyme required for sulfatase activity